jgi:phosphonopyruvate decarboxylase
MKASDFIELLSGGVDSSYFSVPCSVLDPITEYLAGQDSPPILCSNEGEAVAMAAGTGVGNCSPVVFMQNSGLGNALNPITSLVATFDIPLTLVIGHRGAPGQTDEPQHQLMGEITKPLLESIGFTTLRVDREITTNQLRETLQEARESNNRLAFLVQRGAISRTDAVTEADSSRSSDTPLPRSRYIRTIAQMLSDDAWLVSTTGKISRELESSSDRRRNLYMVGSMGCVLSLAIGIGTHTSGTAPIVVIDGDGAFMMRMENLASVYLVRGQPLIHIVLDNGVHESTGGQWSTSNNVDMAAVASACGYGHTFEAEDVDNFRLIMRRALETPTTTFVRVRVGVEDTQALGRPGISPSDNWSRLVGSAGSVSGAV